MPGGPPVRKTEGGVERSRSRHRFVHTLHKTFSLLKIVGVFITRARRRRLLAPPLLSPLTAHRYSLALTVRLVMRGSTHILIWSSAHASVPPLCTGTRSGACWLSRGLYSLHLRHISSCRESRECGDELLFLFLIISVILYKLRGPKLTCRKVIFK